jgi:hypothetical protein
MRRRIEPMKLITINPLAAPGICRNADCGAPMEPPYGGISFLCGRPGCGREHQLPLCAACREALDDGEVVQLRIRIPVEDER